MANAELMTEHSEVIDLHDKRQRIADVISNEAIRLAEKSKEESDAKLKALMLAQADALHHLAKEFIATDQNNCQFSEEQTRVVCMETTGAGIAAFFHKAIHGEGKTETYTKLRDLGIEELRQSLDDNREIIFTTG